MSKDHGKMVGTYKMCDDGELLQFAISFPSTAYPQVMAEVEATMLRLIHDALADVLAQTRLASEAE